MRSLVLLCSIAASVAGCVDDGTPDPGDPALERCACVEDLAAEALTPDAIAALPDQIGACLRDDPAELEADAEACLPVTLGVDARNDLDVVVSYYCSDVCPDAGGIHVAYASVAEDECCAAGGVPNYDFAWGGYVGCFPPETPGGEPEACG
jgi:hypothetical protein